MATSALEAFPAEVRLLVLQDIPDLKTLLNLIIASRTYNETHQAYYEEVVRAVILNDIANQGIFQFQPIAWIELCVDPQHRLSSEVERAIQHYYRQSQRGQAITMTYEECLPFLALKDARTWGIVPLGTYIMYAGGSIFRLRRIVSSAPFYNAENREFRFLSMSREVPSFFLYEAGTSRAW